MENIIGLYIFGVLVSFFIDLWRYEDKLKARQTRPLTWSGIWNGLAELYDNFTQK